MQNLFLVKVKHQLLSNRYCSSKRALAKWDKSTITWNSQPKISDDYIAETQCTGEEGNRHTLDITDWVQDSRW